MAMVTESTVGMAMGIPPMSNTSRLLIPSRYARFWMGHITIISMITPTAMEPMQNVPMAFSTCSKQHQQQNQQHK